MSARHFSSSQGASTRTTIIKTELKSEQDIDIKTAEDIYKGPNSVLTLRPRVIVDRETGQLQVKEDRYGDMSSVGPTD